MQSDNVRLKTHREKGDPKRRFPSTSNKWIVVTTINPPDETMQVLIDTMGHEWAMVVVGDAKTPDEWESTGIHYLSLDRQHALYPVFSKMAPTNHYSRKNIGYLYAIQNGARCILETDDDNRLWANLDSRLSPVVSGRVVGGGDWVNVYRYFSHENIWPRGLPLDAIHLMGRVKAKHACCVCPIQQFLVNADPDVDAVFRLVFKGKAVTFNRHASPVILDAGTWAPFNSQNTLFYEAGFSMLYLPHFVSFRMTDIWRSLVAQASLWTRGYRLAFHTATATQIRNAHNLMSDFELEIPGYLSNRTISAQLQAEVDRLEANPDMSSSRATFRMWHRLIDMGVIPKTEQPLLDEWFSCIETELDRRENNDHAFYRHMGQQFPELLSSGRVLGRSRLSSGSGRSYLHRATDRKNRPSRGGFARSQARPSGGG